MMTLLLADDEPMIVKGLKKLIDWKKLNFQIIGTASDGEEALNIIREKNPHLLISDINMPKMNGIDLLRTINEENYRTQVIFISGFHDFEYAHAALKYGARDYLLKPIDETQLESAIVKMMTKENLYPFQEYEEIPLDLKVKDDITRGFTENLKGYFSISNCQMAEVSQVHLSQGEKSILHFSIFNIIKDFFSDLGNFQVMDRKKNILVLFFHENRDTLINLQKSLLVKLVHLVKESFNESLVISTGRIVNDIQLINESCLSSLETMNSRYYYGNDSVIYYTGVNRERYSVEALFSEQGYIIDCLLKSDRDLYKQIESYLNVLKQISFGNKDATISYCLGTLITIKKNLEKMNILSLSLSFIDRDILNELHELDSFELLEGWFHDRINKISQEVKSSRDTVIHPDIHKIKQYITKNYQKNITLQDLSDLIFLHPNYLSGYFKRQTGMNFKDYLTEIRMEQAEKLLSSSDLKVYEIAEKVGFTDFRHFSEVFRKKFGVSPRAYKKQIIP